MNSIAYQLAKILPDKIYLQLIYYKHFHKWINFNNPQSFNEKLQWLKVNDRREIYTDLVDKYKVKKIIEDTLGKQYVVPTIGKWEKPQDIDFEKLPSQFVLKCNHDSGGIVVCKNKNDFDYKGAIKKLKKAQKRNPYWYGREWQYKNVKRCIIAEPYLQDSKLKELRDYKFFVFNGEVKALLLITECKEPHGINRKFDWFDEMGTHLPMESSGENASTMPELPINFELMKTLSIKLAKNVKHARVDFYEVDSQVYFGEFTLHHTSGLTPFSPAKWDDIFGSWLDLDDSL